MKICARTFPSTIYLLAMPLLVTLSGCSSHIPATPVEADAIAPEIPVKAAIKVLSPRPHKEIARMGYAIQVGAFSKIENAVRLAANLSGKGLAPYYFLHKSGLYKVRFGNFSTLSEAKRQADHFVQSSLITDYYLVRPESYAAHQGDAHLRQQLIRTADSFIGIPYKWGGESAESGFDCSGLTMAVYKLNGLNLPRNSRSQFKAGKPVKKDELQKGDLVFFATDGGKQVSHVGIYTGSNTFIHAPQTGKRIQSASLDNSYFRRRYKGGRRYL